jgi:prolipoprotein diacylglyceryltransferase
MHFPVDIAIFGHHFPPHAVMETLAYAGGFQLYRMVRGRFERAKLPAEQHWWVLVGCVLGALAGSKLLAWVESINEYWPMLSRPGVWLGAKTIVGGLLGGWIGVEIVKKWLGIRRSTGDAFVFPLIAGIAIGRVGCFLAGLADHTYGVATGLPWGVDFGDGVWRHPTQLYEILFLVMLGVALAIYMRWPRRNGALFRLFMLGYLGWRLFIEFYKPRLELAGPLSAIQSACIVGMVVCIILLWRDRPRGGRKTGSAEADPTVGAAETLCRIVPTSFTN